MILLENHKRLTNHVYTFCFLHIQLSFNLTYIQINSWVSENCDLTSSYGHLHVSWWSTLKLHHNSSFSVAFLRLSFSFSLLEKAWETRVAPSQYMVNDSHKGIVVPLSLSNSHPFYRFALNLGPSKKNGTSRPNYSHHSTHYSTHYLTQLYQFNPTKPHHSPTPWAWADRTWALPGDLLWASAWATGRRLNSLPNFHQERYGGFH